MMKYEKPIINISMFGSEDIKTTLENQTASYLAQQGNIDAAVTLAETRNAQKRYALTIIKFNE